MGLLRHSGPHCHPTSGEKLFTFVKLSPMFQVQLQPEQELQLTEQQAADHEHGAPAASAALPQRE